MNDLFDIRVNKGQVFVELKRKITDEDFVPVLEHCNSVSFILGWMNEDMKGWRFSEEERENIAKLKVYLFCGEELKKELKELRESEQINSKTLDQALVYLQPLIKIHLDIRSFEEEINKSEVAASREIYEKAAAECNRAIKRLNKSNLMAAFI